jgi:hypothetical protein
MGTLLTVAGVAIQLVGAVVALRGLITTHDAYADKRIRTLAAERVQRWRVRTVRTINRVLGRPQNVTVGVAGAIATAGSLRARAIVTWGPLPKKTADALAEIDRRLRDLQRRIDSIDERTADAEQARTADMKALRTDLEQAAKDANQQVRHAAIEGLMGEAVGLMLVIVGGVLQAWGALIPSA